MTAETAAVALTLLGALAPIGFFAMVSIPSLANRPLGEAATAALSKLCFGAGLASLLGAWLALELTPQPRLVVELGEWFRCGSYAFHLSLLADRLSLPFAAFALALCGVVASFSHRYLHREPGYNRFFAMLALFAAGITLVILAGSIELVFAGWELVGVSSALLVAFFHERPLPVRNGLRTFVVYRTTDVGLVAAAVLLHHALGTGEFGAFVGSESWPGGSSPLGSGTATAVALLLWLSAMGKCAQIPFSGWLPRAMEGPTPSSAIFYGALSVHAGAYLMLRVAPLLDRSPVAAASLVALGGATALHATCVGRVQSDIKSALAYASLTQVGIILAEIGLGLRWIAVAHILGHASVRSLQFLRAPSLLHDLHQVESAVGGHLARTGLHLERAVAGGLQRRLYRMALDRWRLDEALDCLVVEPFLAIFRRLDALDRRWCRIVAGAGSRSPSSHVRRRRAGG
ncbi:MAG: oxidoreductase [Myxococcales bacterium]|nr:MAG: oxidoreductase [Myxococcales bacterium]